MNASEMMPAQLGITVLRVSKLLLTCESSAQAVLNSERAWIEIRLGPPLQPDYAVTLAASAFALAASAK